MGMIRAAILAALLPFSLVAQPVGFFQCSGLVPDWSLALAGEKAMLSFDGRQLEMDIPQMSRAEGRDSPFAATLINDDAFTTAIVLLDHSECVSGAQTLPLRGYVLTQRGNQPILLTGCCRPDR